GILPTIGGEERESNGFIDRLLFVFPEGVKKEYWSNNQLSPDIPALWTSIVNKLLSLTPGIAENGDEYARKLKFTSEAQEIINTWQRKNTDRCNEDESYSGIGAKIEI